MPKTHWALGMKSVILVPPPSRQNTRIDNKYINPSITQAFADAQEKGIHGQVLTLFLLARINEWSNGKLLESNLVLLHNNATLATKIAKMMSA